MKYVLKKDLPFAKAGSTIYNYLGQIFNIKSDYDCFVKVSEAIFPISYLYKKNQMVFIGDKRDLIDKWIEEVKPREFFINEHSSGSMYVWEASAKQIEWGNPEDNKIIKVREVIE